MAVRTWKKSIVQYFFDRYAAWQLEELMAPSGVIELEYAVDPSPRYGYGKPPHPLLNSIIGARADDYEARLSAFLNFADRFSAIAQEDRGDATAPTFRNNFFSGLDAIAYYGIVATQKPRTIFEIGSGFSTKFARRAIRDNGLGTRIITCDPQPRAEVDSISDEVIRVPFETLDLSRLDDLGENDVLFIDGSHQCFTNSDVTVQFLEALPRLRPGVLVHHHDIMLPYDYPPEWSKRYYSEQYLLASYLLASSGRLQIIFPSAYISKSERFAPLLAQIGNWPGMHEAWRFAAELHHGYRGYSFWTRIAT
jgi:hypothetical protein